METSMVNTICYAGNAVLTADSEDDGSLTKQE